MGDERSLLSDELKDALNLLSLDDYTQQSGLESAIATVLKASRQCESKIIVSSDVHWDHILAIALLLPDNSETTSWDVHIQALKCIGNLVADDNNNRDRVLAYARSLSSLRDFLTFSTAADGEHEYGTASTALKVLYNLCNDYPRAQKESLAAGIDTAVLSYIHTCLFISKDETIELAVELLGNLTEHSKDAVPAATFDKDLVSEVLRLPCVEDVDQETFIDMTTAISPYLALPAFQEQILISDQSFLLFDLLERAVFLLSNSPQADQGPAIEALLVRALTDISSLPSFPRALPPKSPFIQTLTSCAVLKETEMTSASPAIASCILLGNLSTSPTSASTITAQLRLPDLYDAITLKAYRRSRASTTTLSHSGQDVPAYLHAAAGMLRHLAMPLDVRDEYFRDEAAKQTAMALVQFDHVEVRIAGLRLLRQVLVDNVRGLEHVAHGSYTSMLVKIFGEDVMDGRVKLEITRTVVAVLRSVARAGEDQEMAEKDTVSDIVETRDLLLPLVYAVVESKIAFAQAEGWLGFCLFIRSWPDGGARAVSDLCLREKSVLQALRKQIVGPAPEGVASGRVLELPDEEGTVGASHAMLPIQGERTAAADGVSGKARDNAIVLLSELLKSDDIDHGFRDDLDGIAAEAGITLRL